MKFWKWFAPDREIEAPTPGDAIPQVTALLLRDREIEKLRAELRMANTSISGLDSAAKHFRGQRDEARAEVAALKGQLAHPMAARPRDAKGHFLKVNGSAPATS